MIDIRRIRELLTQVQQPPDDTPAEGLSESECDAFEQRTGIRLPNDLRQWLGLVNGPCIGPGGLYGIHTRRSHLDMEGFLARFPQWRASKWIPVAGDGCGNHYVVATRHEYGSGDPVLFVDTSTTPDAPSFIVSSDIGHFIVALLEQELGSKGWPFDKVYVTKADPAICEFYDVPVPWTAD
jgi:cell wall assembly regulator SMI1